MTLSTGSEPEQAEKTYTLAQAQAELARQACAEGGHAPVHAYKTLASYVAIRWTCECGKMSWVPEP